MKLTIKTEPFLGLLLPLQTIVNDGHIVPALQSVKLDFEPGKIAATGNDLEVCCTTTLEQALAIKKPLSICVNFTMLLAIVKSISDKELVLETTKNNINIIHGKGNFDLPTETAQAYPTPQTEDFTKKATVSGTGFRSAIKVANKFIANDDIDATGNISLSIGKKIHIRSTDKNRLFEEKVKGKGDAEDILISGKSGVSLFALLEEMKEDIEMKYNTNSIYFKFDNKEITVIQQQGKFPLEMFNKVIAVIKESECLKLNIKSFVTALKRVSIMSAKEKYSTVRLNISKKNMIVSCESEISATKAEESVDVEFFEKRLLGYNYKYLIEVLSVFDKEPELFIDSRGLLFIKEKKKTGALSPIRIND